MPKLKVGVLGCGEISKAYLATLTGEFTDRVEVTAVADVVEASAKTRAEEFKVARALTPDQLIADPDVQLVANLTPAPIHYATTKAALTAGKHVYSEKPLALTMEQGRELVTLAMNSKLRLAVAPDTLLGGGVQTTRKLIEDGTLGTVVAASGMVCLPQYTDRYFQVFRGPLLDLGPYHVGALLMLLGPVKSVVGMVQKVRPVPAKPPLAPESFTLDAPGQAAAVFEHASGALSTLIFTVENLAYTPELRIFGSKGSVFGSDPNQFHGPVKFAAHYKPAEEVPLPFAHCGKHRGVGIWEIAGAIAENRPHRLGPDFALHQLDVMLAVIDSHKTGKRIDLTTTFAPQPPMPTTQG